MRFDIMTLFPEMVDSILSESIIGRAREAEKVEVKCHNIRDYSTDKHNRVDDTPYGGGMGMLMSPVPVYDCFKAITADREVKPYTVYLSPKGTVFNQKKAYELRDKGDIVLLCGHYEGIDQRVIDEIVDEEISIGNYVLTGGELAAAVIVDAVSRLCDGVLSADECFENETFADGLLEYPQYTRPVEWHGVKVPDVLLSGHHANIEAWRRQKSIELTLKMRPDLIKEENGDLAAKNNK